jgi:hypothetical protein
LSFIVWPPSIKVKPFYTISRNFASGRQRKLDLVWLHILRVSEEEAEMGPDSGLHGEYACNYGELRTNLHNIKAGWIRNPVSFFFILTESFT